MDNQGDKTLEIDFCLKPYLTLMIVSCFCNLGFLKQNAQFVICMKINGILFCQSKTFKLHQLQKMGMTNFPSVPFVV